MIYSKRFQATKSALAGIIAGSIEPADLSHAENIVNWLLILEPKADEALQLAAYGHDVERARPDRFTAKMFETYDDYKRAHAARAGQMVAEIALEAGYVPAVTERIARIIEAAEFSSADPDVQLICDADSISFFDNNLSYYVEAHGLDNAQEKCRFMFERASVRAQRHIQQVLSAKPELNLLDTI